MGKMCYLLHMVEILAIDFMCNINIIIYMFIVTFPLKIEYKNNNIISTINKKQYFFMNVLYNKITFAKTTLLHVG